MLKFLLGLAVLVLFVWFGANIPLGSRTLFEHLQAIGRTRETQDLVDGTRDSARPLVDDVRRRLGAATATDDRTKNERRTTDAGAPPAEDVSPADRQKLRKLLEAKPSSR